MEHKVFYLREEDSLLPCPFCGKLRAVIIVDNMENPIHPADYQMVHAPLSDYERDTGKKWEHFPHFDVDTFCKKCGMPCSHITFESRDAVNNWIEKSGSTKPHACIYAWKG